MWTDINLVELVYTWVIPLDIQLQIFLPNTKGCKVSMCCIQWGGMHLDCPPKAKMLFSKGPINLLILRYLVVTSEHPLLSSILSDSHRKCVEEYRELASRRSELERIELHKEKTGVFSGSYARNPASGEAIPIWVADYVLGRSCALIKTMVPRTIMVVPAHDSHDHEFAMRYNIPIH
ncbi:hypothetical protein IFM89_011138 [Coptis chinensis]|uniref:leucine--tRNA ligase n=1 Tax=Coptis chinensis TaxID=261450 RepID=A0A835LRB4_9MAGN|nr:hypothetical protein IFM89_011138 [Coptis chinensis]